MKKRTLKKLQLLEAYSEYTCERWRDSIRQLLIDNILKRDDDAVEIPQCVVDLLLKEGSSGQKAYVTQLGLSLIEDRNAFVKEFEEKELYELSDKLFNNGSIFQILVNATPENRPDLKGRAFFVHSGFNVTLLPANGNLGTVIEITKK